MDNVCIVVRYELPPSLLECYQVQTIDNMIMTLNPSWNLIGPFQPVYWLNVRVQPQSSRLNIFAGHLIPCMVVFSVIKILHSTCVCVNYLWVAMKICILCHFFQDFNIFLFHHETRVAWGPYLSLLPEVVVLQDEHVIWDLRRLSIFVTRTYVIKCTACWQNCFTLQNFLELWLLPSPLWVSVIPIHLLGKCCISSCDVAFSIFEWYIRRFTCISELIFVTTKLLATLLGSSSVYVTNCWRAWKWRNWITAVEQSLVFWRPHICMLMLSYAHIQ